MAQITDYSEFCNSQNFLPQCPSNPDNIHIVDPSGIVDYCLSPADFQKYFCRIPASPSSGGGGGGSGSGNSDGGNNTGGASLPIDILGALSPATIQSEASAHVQNFLPQISAVLVSGLIAMSLKSFRRPR